MWPQSCHRTIQWPQIFTSGQTLLQKSFASTASTQQPCQAGIQVHVILLQMISQSGTSLSFKIKDLKMNFSFGKEKPSKWWKVVEKMTGRRKSTTGLENTYADFLSNQRTRSERDASPTNSICSFKSIAEVTRPIDLASTIWWVIIMSHHRWITIKNWALRRLLLLQDVGSYCKRLRIHTSSRMLLENDDTLYRT